MVKRRRYTHRDGLLRMNHFASSVRIHASKFQLLMFLTKQSVSLSLSHGNFIFLRNETAKKPGFFEDLFCNLGCYEEYSWRTSSRYLRGVCLITLTLHLWRTPYFFMGCNTFDLCRHFSKLNVAFAQIVN